MTITELKYAGNPNVFKLEHYEEEPKTPTYLTPEQRQVIIAPSNGAQSFFRAIAVTGERPGEWSRQHMADRFRAELGVTPKTAARISRFERACGLISNLRQPLSDVAAACGYADQAHMRRDWNASPKAWIASELPFLQDYELSCHDDDVGTSTPSLVVTGRMS